VQQKNNITEITETLQDIKYNKKYNKMFTEHFCQNNDCRTEYNYYSIHIHTRKHLRT